tara:strand:- start:1077 stop:1547 length:471 start_codon:yes stop_codon:yes gene_type:complete
MDKKGLWQTDVIAEKYYNEALHYNTPEGKEDEMPRRVPMSWINNMGMSTKDANDWVRKNGAVGAKGTIPTWSIAEFMQDPDVKWEDMMINDEKKAVFLSYEVNTENDIQSNGYHLMDTDSIDSGVKFTSASRELLQRPGRIKMNVIKKYKSDKINV